MIIVSEMTLKEAAGDPPKSTTDAPVKPLPVNVTGVPCEEGPTGGLTLVIAGVLSKGDVSDKAKRTISKKCFFIRVSK